MKKNWTCSLYYVKKYIPSKSGSAMIKNLTFKCEGEGFKFSHL